MDRWIDVPTNISKKQRYVLVDQHKETSLILSWLYHMFIIMQTYIPLNKENTHWITVVMHSEKKEFPILDSLMSGKLDSDNRKLVEDLVRFFELGTG